MSSIITKITIFEHQNNSLKDPLCQTLAHRDVHGHPQTCSWTAWAGRASPPCTSSASRSSRVPPLNMIQIILIIVIIYNPMVTFCVYFCDLLHPSLIIPALTKSLSSFCSSTPSKSPGMILQLIQLLQHLLIHLIDLSHNLIPHTSLVHQVRDVVPKVQSNQSLLYHLQNPHLEAMTKGNWLTVIAWL